MNLRFLLLAACTISMASGALAQGARVSSVFAEPVREREFANRIEALGTLEPRERAELTLNASDRVTAVYFEDGERVKEGKTLVSLAQREQVALVEAAEAANSEASKQLERLTRLAEQKAVSQSELDVARRNYDSTIAQLRAVQSRQSDRVLVAPFDGVLGFRMVSVGSYLSPGDVVATLIDDSEMRLEFSVPSIFLRTLQPGLEINATTADLPGETFRGTLTSIDNAIDPITRAVRVRATIPNEERKLKAGMFMMVTLEADPRTALSIPEEAVQPQGPNFFVFVVERSGDTPTAQRKQIQLGLRQEGHVEVTEGLTASDEVITEGIIRIRDGSPIRVESKSMLEPGVSSGSAASSRGSAAAPG